MINRIAFNPYLKTQRTQAVSNASQENLFTYKITVSKDASEELAKKLGPFLIFLSSKSPTIMNPGFAKGEIKFQTKRPIEVLGTRKENKIELNDEERLDSIKLVILAFIENSTPSRPSPGHSHGNRSRARITWPKGRTGVRNFSQDS